MTNLDLEVQTLDEQRQMRNLANAIELADSFSLLFVRCNQRSRQKEIIEELQARLTDLDIKIIFLEHQIEHLLDELQTRLCDEKPDAVFVYGLESSFPKADEAADSPFVVTLNHARNSFKNVLACPLVLFLPEYALSAIYHGATDFYSIRSGVYLFSARAEETEHLISGYTKQNFRKLRSLLLDERKSQIQNIKKLLAESQALPEFQRNLNNENRLKEKLAESYSVTEEYKDAVDVYKEVIESARKTEDYVSLSRTLNGLAVVYKNLQRYDEAIELYKESLREVRKTIGTKNPDYAAALNNLGAVYKSLKKEKEATELFEESLNIFREIVGVEHPDYAIPLSNLAVSYQDQGKYSEAENLFREALNILEKTVGKENMDYADSLNNLGANYIYQEKYREALQIYQQAYSILIKLLGRSHSRVSRVNRHIDVCRQKMKERASLIVPYKK